MTRLEKIDRLHRQAEAKSAKRSRKKDELADAAIDALKQLGYARTSLRDIAAMSGVSVGTLHYYFEDKVDLIAFCVRRYKSTFVSEMDAILQGGGEGETLIASFIRGLSRSIRRDAQTHRLWYDIRAQAMFDPAFHEVVGEIEAALLDLVRQLLCRLGLPAEGAMGAYFMIDGAFRYYLQRFLAGDERAASDFEARVSGHFSWALAQSAS